MMLAHSDYLRGARGSVRDARAARRLCVYDEGALMLRQHAPPCCGAASLLRLRRRVTAHMIFTRRACRVKRYAELIFVLRQPAPHAAIRVIFWRADDARHDA